MDLHSTTAMSSFTAPLPHYDVNSKKLYGFLIYKITLYNSDKFNHRSIYFKVFQSKNSTFILCQLILYLQLSFEHYFITYLFINNFLFDFIEIDKNSCVAVCSEYYLI